ncbi:MAG: hypothetical protein ABSD62_10625 [Candidatus Limnocylindrales bacterium]|jgi:hypothetical protein
MSDPWPLWLAKQRHAELIHEAEQYRLAREAEQYRLATAHPGKPADHPSARLLKSIRAGLGRPFAAVRRGLSGYQAPCDDLCPDCATS